MNPATGPDLRDIHLPRRAGWWPPAPGWWVLGAIVLAALVYLCVKLYLYTKRQAPASARMRELDRCVDARTTIRRCSPPVCRNSCGACALRTAPRAAAYRRRALDHAISTSRPAPISSAAASAARCSMRPIDPHATYDSFALIALVRRFARNVSTGRPTMLSWAWPWLFVALPLPWLAARLPPGAQPMHRTRCACPLRFATWPPPRAPRPWRAGVLALALLAWLLLVAAARARNGSATRKPRRAPAATCCSRSTRRAA